MEYPTWSAPGDLRNGYVIAVFAAAVLTAATMYRPAAGSPPDPAALAALILAGLVTALGRELVWHGFIQTTLVRKLGTVWGFLATEVLVGLLHLACLASFQPWLLSYPFGWLELLLEPGWPPSWASSTCVPKHFELHAPACLDIVAAANLVALKKEVEILWSIKRKLPKRWR